MRRIKLRSRDKTRVIRRKAEKFDGGDKKREPFITPESYPLMSILKFEPTELLFSSNTA
jgi:hypothetical protein